MGTRNYFTALGAIACAFGISGLSIQPVQAEGSNDLVSSGGNRPFLEFRTDLNGGIPRRSIIKVYAQVGETINLGSSAVEIGSSGVINYRDPNNVAGTCGAAGLIASRAQEVAGPGDGSAGTFVPCVVTVAPGQEGIWEIDFVSPEPGSGGNPTPIAGTSNWTQPTNNGMVAAWDVTVKSSGGVPILGRVYANYYAFNIGSNGRSLSSAFTVLTKEGYQYSVDLNGIDPFGFIFFSNRNGFFDTNTGDSIFRSLQFVNANPGDLPPGYSFHNPNNADVGVYVTQKTFINAPDATMPASANSPTGPTWLYQPPEPPPVPTNFAFTGIEGTPGQSGTSPLGGTLTFDSTSQNAYSITLDLNNDGMYGTGNDRTFVGRSVVGANSIFWDGADGNGVPVPSSAIPYNVRINQYAGEAHFPLIDAEQHNNGIIIERLNQAPVPTSPDDDPFNIYYDDRNTGTDFTVCASGETGVDCYGGGPTPREALTGVNSSTGQHRFTSNFGNRRGIDSWVYFPSRDVELSGGIVIKEADLIVDKTVSAATADPGDPLTYFVDVTNDGPDDEPGIRFRDTVPASLTGVTWTCTILSGTGSCGTAGGSGNVIDTTLDLNDQAVARYEIIGTISNSASGTILNSAEVIRNNDITDPDLTNNVDDAETTITSVPPPGGTLCYALADDGNQLVSIDINTGNETQIGGAAGVSNIEAIAYWPITQTLYAANANSLGTLNTTTGAYSNIGSFGSGTGSSGSKTFSDVDGLAFHPFTGELYGSVRDADGPPEDLLIKIDPSTGAHVPNAFGAGVDYLVIQTATPTGFNDVDDLAFDPDTGFLYGIANQGSGSADAYIRIDTNTGAVTSIGPFGTSDMEGLTSFNDGKFYGTTGNSRQFYSIDKATGTATPIGSPLSVGGDYEGVACLVGPPNRITGTVFLDPNTNGTLDGGDSGTANVSVRLYRDVNGNSVVDGGDIQLTAQNSLGDGTFDFLFAANGGFVLDIDPADLPPENGTLTTDNLEVADFGILLNATDPNNNFGHFTDSNLALVKRITAINGVSLPDSVDDTGDVDDNHPNWPAGLSGAGISTFLAGATERSVEPGDVVEYTVYYLATGNFPVTNVMLCDRIPPGTTYIPESMVLFTSGNTSNLTDINTDGDGGEFLAAGDASPVPCTSANTDGTVSVNLAPSPAQLPNATGPGTPTNAYGFIRFRVTVD